MTTPASVQLKGLPKRPDEYGRPQPDAQLHVVLDGLRPQPKGEAEYLARIAQAEVDKARKEVGSQAAEPPKEEAKVSAAAPSQYAKIAAEYREERGPNPFSEPQTLEEALKQAETKFLADMAARKPVQMPPSDAQLVEFYENRITELLAFRKEYAATLRQLADLLEQ